MFFDLRKAFEFLNIEFIINRLESVWEHPLEYIKYFVTEHKLTVKVGHNFYSDHNVIHGILEGSALVLLSFQNLLITSPQ